MTKLSWQQEPGWGKSAAHYQVDIHHQKGQLRDYQLDLDTAAILVMPGRRAGYHSLPARQDQYGGATHQRK